MTMSTQHPIDKAEKPVFYLTEEHHPEGSTMLGFWLYLMSDCLIFAILFATYAVLGRNYAAGPSPADLFDLPLVAINTAPCCCSPPSPMALPCCRWSGRQGGNAVLACRHRPVRRSLPWPRTL
jgi:hypothetical protein